MQLKDVLPRYVHGSAHYRSKLTDEDVSRIRDLRAQGATMSGLARALGVSAPTIRCVLTGETWRHVPVSDKAAPTTTTA